MTIRHQYGIMQGVGEEYSLAPFAFSGDCSVYQILEIPDQENLEINYIFLKNLYQLCANALAVFFKFPHNIIYIYIYICTLMHMYI